MKIDFHQRKPLAAVAKKGVFLFGVGPGGV